MLREDLKNLSTEEKIVLVQELWDSIEQETFTTLSPAQKKLITEREKLAKQPNAKFLTWEEIAGNIRANKKK